MKKYFSEKIFYNKILFQTKNFFVVPSLGSLIPGWLLIVPKKYYLNFSLIPKEELSDLNLLIEKIKNDSKEFFGERFVLFEHGPQGERSKVGCGVDYAHLHFVPTSINLMEGLKILDFNFKWEEVNSLQELSFLKNTQLEYLFLEDQDHKSFISFNRSIPSQLFRKVIANYLGIPEKYDWKKFSFNENIALTINKFSEMHEY